MTDVVGIRFKSCGKIYDFDSNHLALSKGAQVVIESEFGLSIGTVVEPPHPESSHKELKKVLRIVTEDDLRQKEANEKFEQEAKTFCYERIMARGLPMKLVRAETALDKKRIIFYFTADGRIDFRELVKDLAARFKMRIEMRQIGVRDKAKLVGGFGLCGRELCCKVFLTTFEPISIKMAKQQDLTLNTGKLSGSCGRLMCCLGYEYFNGSSVPEPAERRSGQSREEQEIPTDLQTTESGSHADETSGEDAPVASALDSPEQKETQQQRPPLRKRKRKRRHKRKPQKNE